MQFPMKFEVEATASCKVGDPWECQSHALPPVKAAIPPEFMGPGGGYSPEDFFAFAVVNCIIATYKVYVEKAGVTFEQVQGKANLTVDLVGGALKMATIDIFIHVEKASDIEKAKTLLDKAAADCAISNSIQSGKTFQLTVS